MIHTFVTLSLPSNVSVIATKLERLRGFIVEDKEERGVADFDDILF